jgi:hypothetical protein
MIATTTQLRVKVQGFLIRFTPTSFGRTTWHTRMTTATFALLQSTPSSSRNLGKKKVFANTSHQPDGAEAA